MFKKYILIVTFFLFLGGYSAASTKEGILWVMFSGFYIPIWTISLLKGNLIVCNNQLFYSSWQGLKNLKCICKCVYIYRSKVNFQVEYWDVPTIPDTIYMYTTLGCYPAYNNWVVYISTCIHIPCFMNLSVLLKFMMKHVIRQYMYVWSNLATYMYIQNGLWPFGAPRLLKLRGPLQTDPPSNSLAPVLNIFYSLYILTAFT